MASYLHVAVFVDLVDAGTSLRRERTSKVKSSPKPIAYQPECGTSPARPFTIALMQSVVVMAFNYRTLAHLPLVIVTWHTAPDGPVALPLPVIHLFVRFILVVLLRRGLNLDDGILCLDLGVTGRGPAGALVVARIGDGATA